MEREKRCTDDSIESKVVAERISSRSNSPIGRKCATSMKSEKKKRRVDWSIVRRSQGSMECSPFTIPTTYHLSTPASASNARTPRQHSSTASADRHTRSMGASAAKVKFVGAICSKRHTRTHPAGRWPSVVVRGDPRSSSHSRQEREEKRYRARSTAVRFEPRGRGAHRRRASPGALPFAAIVIHQCTLYTKTDPTHQ